MQKVSPITILNVPVHPYTMSTAVYYIMDRVEHKLKTFVVTANAEIIMMGQSDKQYYDILCKADLVLPDGAGTVWAGKYLGYDVPERVAGFDLFLEIIKAAADKPVKIFFFGAAPGIAKIAKEKCEIMAPGVNIVGYRDGYFTDQDNNAIIKEINDSEADILFLALGAPKQEKWLAQFQDELKPTLSMGIGGSFDVLAGKMARAPKWMQESSLEWLFRLYKQPSRFMRMLALPKFVLRVISYKINKNS